MFDRKYTWVITGGAGFIGSHLAQALLQQGQTVRVVDDFSTGRAENLSEIASQIQLFSGSVCDADLLARAFAGADFVLHYAALVSVPQSVQEPLKTWQTNVQGTAHMLQAARQSGVRRVVFACSSAIYGNGPEICTENTPRNSQSPYALSKQIGAELCRLYTRLYGLETISLIYFNVFGPGKKADSAYADVIAKFLQQARQGGPLRLEGDGQQSRDFIHVQDAVRATLRAALTGEPGQGYNVASGKSYSLLQLADLLDQISGQKLTRTFAPGRPGDVKRSCADISKIRALGFTPSVSLEEGLREMWLTKPL